MPQITAKFSPGDLVYLIASNKITQLPVQSVNIWRPKEEIEIAYNVGVGNNADRYGEWEVFATKEELLASL